MDKIAPGYRFFPTEEELVEFYLRHKLEGRLTQNIDAVIPVLDIYYYDPWDLPRLSGELCRRDPQLQEWFFFIPRQEKEARGGRPNRITASGYWKATGSPGYVYNSPSDRNRIIGEKRTMVFYQGRAPGRKTDWKMNEYRAIDDKGHDHEQASSSSSITLRLEFSVCRVYIKSKCLRSFDRRPSSPGHVLLRSTDVDNSLTSHRQQHDLPAASDHYHHHHHQGWCHQVPNDDQLLANNTNECQHDPLANYSIGTSHNDPPTTISCHDDHGGDKNNIRDAVGIKFRRGTESSASSGTDDHHHHHLVVDPPRGQASTLQITDIDDGSIWEWDPFNWV